MKNILAILIFSTGILTAQDFNPITFNIETGFQSVSDETAVIRDNYKLNFSGGVRYNINNLFGIGLSASYDELSTTDINVPGDYYSEFARLNLEGNISVFEMLRLRHKYINFQLHGGPGIASLNNETLFNMTGGLRGLLKISKSLALTVGYKTSVNIGQDNVLNRNKAITNAGINSTIDHVVFGINFYPGGKGKQPSDFSVAPEPIYTIIEQRAGDVINNTHHHTTVNTVDSAEYVYFHHDNYNIDKDGLNAIAKSADKLSKDKKVYVSGYASLPGSDSYNLKLSENRANAVVSKLKSLGVPVTSIVLSFDGEIDTFDGNNEDLSRRVKIEVR